MSLRIYIAEDFQPDVFEGQTPSEQDGFVPKDPLTVHMHRRMA